MTIASAAFIDGYVATAMWITDDEGGEPLDSNYGPWDLTAYARSVMKRDCNAFYKFADLWSGKNDWDAGHDFWLTRNRHGAGFWDGDYENYKQLTDLAHKFGEANLYVTARGKIDHG